MLSDIKDAVQFMKRKTQIWGGVLPRSGIGFRTLYYAERPHFGGDGIIRYCIVAVLNKMERNGPSLEERYGKLLAALEASLVPGEHLEFRNRAVLCIEEGYEITIVAEAYRKRPSVTVFRDESVKVRVEPLFRMSTYESIRRAKALSGMLWNWNIAKSPFSKFLDEPELSELFPNAADRLAFIVKREMANSPKSYAELMQQFKQ